MEQHFKRYKCSNKDFYRWMVSEIEDFYPSLTPEDPLKRFSDLLDKNPLTQISHNGRKKLAIAKPAQTARPLKYGPSFHIEKYWKRLSNGFTKNFIKFLDLKDIIMLMYTCKYFHEALDQGSIWEVLQIRDFPSFCLKERVSEKLYYKYLYLSRVSGIPFHSGYFKAYGSADVVELSDSIVDFLCPKNEMVKKYAGEILMRNQCKIFDLKLSWLKEKNEICLWNGNPSLEYKKPETGNEEIETVNEFYPCFIKRYSFVDEDEEITEVFFLEDKYLVVKLKKKKLEAGKITTIFRILNIEEELHSIAKGLQPAIPFDYSFILTNDGDNVTDIKIDEFGVDCVLNRETECDLKVSLLSGDRAVFYTENSVEPTMIFWDLKEKKKLDFVTIELQKPLNCVLASKKSEVGADKFRLFLLDKNMNVYCGSISEKDGFILNQTISLPISIQEQEEEKKEEEIEKQKQQDEKELEAQSHLNSGKRVTNRKKIHPKYEYLFNTPPKYLKKLEQKFESKTKKYYHEVWKKTNEEWLIVHMRNNFHFVNLDEEKIQEFSADKNIDSGNWTLYEDNLVISKPLKILYYKINFDNHSINFRFCREISRFNIGYTENIDEQWVMLDPCFTVIIFTHAFGLGLAARATIVVTSTQKFLGNTDSYFDHISYKVQAEQFIRIPDRWENKPREIDFKFENSKLLVSTEKANFFFDMTLSSQPYSKVYLNGWTSDSSMQVVKYSKQDVIAAEPEIVLEEGEVKSTKPKMVNYGKLEGNLNIVNAKEKNNGWKKDGKSEAKKEADKEKRVLKGKGEKYQKNIRQGQRSDKIN